MLNLIFQKKTTMPVYVDSRTKKLLKWRKNNADNYYFIRPG